MSTATDGDAATEKPFREFNLSDWNEHWADGRIGFHNDYVHKQLQKYKDELLQGRENIRILVPLCGKSLDMKWLADMGHQVVGVEGAEKGLKEFFTEQGLEYSTEPAQGMPGTLYKSKDNKLRLYHGNFFDFNCSVEGKFDAIWDRASLVAINRPDQERYAELLTSVMAPGCTFLVATLIFDDAIHKGPPHYVRDERVQQLFGEKCRVEKLGEEDAFEPQHIPWGISSLVERIFKMTLK